MDARDILMNDGDIIIRNGDFAVGLSDSFHVETIIKAEKVSFFESPLVGVGIIKELNGSKSKQELKQDIRRQLVLDNYNVDLINIEPSTKTVNVNAKRLK